MINQTKQQAVVLTLQNIEYRQNITTGCIQAHRYVYISLYVNIMHFEWLWFTNQNPAL